ncbi:ankyrin repeat domain-containing protein [Mycena olivaceomarginata]|nr:ankyrin repeat domain-containing protein [Mycena olivaceomarginata]
MSNWSRQYWTMVLMSTSEITIRGGKYETALQAGARGTPEIIKLLLASGADPNIEGGAHGTALQASLSDPACWGIVRLLLPHPNTRVTEGNRVLHDVSIAGEIEVVKMLLKKGANLNAPGGEYGTALQAASQQGKLEIVQLLLRKGADKNIQV